MVRIALIFSHASTANHLVAGIPAAARAAREIALLAGERGNVSSCIIAAPGGWTPSAWCMSELARLAPDSIPVIGDARNLPSSSEVLHLPGEALLTADRIAALLDHARPGLPPAIAAADAGPEQATHRLDRSGRAIIMATGKAGDGIVSRHINRPISRAITARLLRIPGVLPIHATIAAGLLGILMALCLFLGGEAGLMAGALLFQTASIVDGVDGELARSTFRASPAGAMLDSMTDAATNLAFIAGLTFNLWQRGHDGPATAGLAGLAMLAAGLFMIGRRARTNGGPFTFDIVKNHFGARPSRLKQWLTWVTMRDFYAAAAALFVVIGFAHHTVIAFAAIAALWLVVTIVVLIKTRSLTAKDLKKAWD